MKLLDLLRVKGENPDLVLAQFRSNTRQIPLMYFIVLVNTWALVSSFYHRAPALLTVVIPLFLTAVAGMRMLGWWRSRKREATPEYALAALRQTNRLAGFIALGFTSWGVALYPYGDAFSQGHVAFFIGITVIACVYCLSHIRSAALHVVLVTNAAFVALALLSDSMIYGAKALNVLMVSFAMLAVMWTSFRDFENLVMAKKVLTSQRQDLLKRQKETQKLSDENFRLANLDSLTGLPNRRNFFAKAEEYLQDQRASALALGVLDLDGFKAVNDIYGHVTGDRLLQEVASRLETVCGPGVYLSRLGGDEFGLLIRSVQDTQSLQELGNQICADLMLPFRYHEVSLTIGCSIGFARRKHGVDTADQLYEMADFALYCVKRDQRGIALIFGAVHEEEILRDRTIERDLFNPVFEAQLSVHFQPVVEVESGRVLAFEALARWDHPTLGRVPPNKFIAIAERCGFIDRLTEILLEKALRQAQTWPADIRLSFNLSAKNIASLTFANRLIEQIRTSGFDPKRIDFEITETAMIQDFARVHETMSALREIGVRISLDDFGTGFSSLKHLHSFPLDKIKIDRSFVTNIHSGSPGYGIVKSLLNLSREMGIDCIVEGVETAQELAVIRSLGGVMVQGYFYSKPLPAAEVAAFLGQVAGGRSIAS